MTHGGTAFTESQSIQETDSDATSADKKTPYFWFTVWTAANEALAVEYYNSSSSLTARVSDVTLLVMNAEDLITNGDLKYDIQTTGGTLTTTATSKASITWTPANDGDTWWIMGYSQADIVGVGFARFLAQIDIDGTDREHQEIEGEDTSDTPIYGIGWDHRHQRHHHYRRCHQRHHHIRQRHPHPNPQHL